MIYLMFFVLLILIYLVFNTTYINKRKVKILRAEFDALKKDYEFIKKKSTDNKLLIEELKNDVEENIKALTKKLELREQTTKENEESIESL